MNNDNLKQLHELIYDFESVYGEDCYWSSVILAKQDDYDFKKFNEQVTDYENELLENIEYIKQNSGISGDDFEGKLIRKIKGTDFCLVLEYLM